MRIKMNGRRQADSRIAVLELNFWLAAQKCTTNDSKVVGCPNQIGEDGSSHRAASELTKKTSGTLEDAGSLVHQSKIVNTS